MKCITCEGKGVVQNDMYHPAFVCIHCKGSGVEKEISMIKIIALCGRRYSGKTTAAKYIVENLGYTRLRFADRLKKMLVTLGLTEREIDGDLKGCACEVLGGQTPRHAMVTLGTEWGRNMIHPDIWVNALHRDMTAMVNDGHDKFVIDDLRFLSEEKWLKSLKTSYIPIEVTIIKLQRQLTERSEHQSEREVDEIKEDWMVWNNLSMAELHKSLLSIIMCGGGK